MKLTPATGIAAEARPLLRALEPGQSVTVELPTSRYWRRLARSHLSAAAHAIHGRGVCSTDGRLRPGFVTITRRPSDENCNGPSIPA
jgi:hypothetical protein